MNTIYVWPDGNWMFDYEYEEVDRNWNGDEFREMNVPTGLSDSDIQQLIQNK